MIRAMKRLQTAVWAALIAMLVLAAPFLVNHHLRVTYINVLAHYAAKVRPPTYVLVGDSLTSGGAPWGWRLDRNPLSAVSLASNGLGLRQIASSVPAALAYKPKFIVITGGTNDLAPHPGLVRRAVEDARRSCAIPIVTIPPWTKHQAMNESLAQIREAIRDEASGATIVSLDDLSAGGKILPAFTTDGVHLSDAAYDLWALKLREAAGK
jgi:lysophospholipase L1-like esterase